VGNIFSGWRVFPSGREPRPDGTKQRIPGPPRAGHMAGHSLGRIDDTLLVREAQRGNRAAFEELVRHYDQAVLRLAMHLTGSEHEAQDIYQDAFLRAYKSVGNFRFECSFYTWIYRIVTNLCLDHLRKKQVRKEDAPVAVDTEGEPYDVLAQSRRTSRRQSGARLDAPRTGDAHQPCSGQTHGPGTHGLRAKALSGLKLRTVGEILNTTEETAKNTLFRATQKLRGALADMR